MSRRAAFLVVTLAAAAGVLLPAETARPAPAPPVPTIRLWDRSFVWHTDVGNSSFVVGDLHLTQIGAEVGGSFPGGRLTGIANGRSLTGTLKFDGRPDPLPFSVKLNANTYDTFKGKMFDGKKKKKNERTFGGVYERIDEVEKGSTNVRLKVASATKSVKAGGRGTVVVAVQNAGPGFLPARGAHMEVRLSYGNVGIGTATDTTAYFTNVHPESRILDLDLSPIHEAGTGYWQIEEPLGALGQTGDRAICAFTFKVDADYPSDTIEVVAAVRSDLPQFDVFDAEEVGPAVVHLKIPITRK